MIFRRSSFASKQIPKLNLWIGVIIGLGILDFLSPSMGSQAYDWIITFSIMAINVLFISPIFISAFTHNSYGKFSGLWFGLYFALPMIIMAIFNRMTSGENLSAPPLAMLQYFPYISLALLVLILVYINSNRRSIEDRLALNISNRNEDTNFDTIDHFVGEE